MVYPSDWEGWWRETEDVSGGSRGRATPEGTVVDSTGTVVADTGEETPYERVEGIDVPRRPGETIGGGEPPASPAAPAAPAATPDANPKGRLERSLDAIANGYNRIPKGVRNIGYGAGGLFGGDLAYSALAAANPAVAGVAAAAVVGVAAGAGARLAYNRFMPRASPAPSDGSIDDVVVSADDVDALHGGAMPHPARREGILRRAVGYPKRALGYVRSHPRVGVALGAAALGGAAGLAAGLAAFQVIGGVTLVPSLATAYLAGAYGDRALRAVNRVKRGTVNRVKKVGTSIAKSKAFTPALAAHKYLNSHNIYSPTLWGSAAFAALGITTDFAVNFIGNALPYNLEGVLASIAAPTAANIAAQIAVSRNAGDNKVLRRVMNYGVVPIAAGVWFGNYFSEQAAILYNYNAFGVSGLAGTVNALPDPVKELFYAGVRFGAMGLRFVFAGANYVAHGAIDRVRSVWGSDYMREVRERAASNRAAAEAKRAARTGGTPSGGG